MKSTDTEVYFAADSIVSVFIVFRQQAPKDVKYCEKSELKSRYCCSSSYKVTKTRINRKRL